MAKAKKEKKEKTGKKKKLPIILLGVVLVAAIAAAVVLFVLPKLNGGGDSSGGSESSSKSSSEKKKEDMPVYTVGEDSVIAVEGVMEEGEGELIANRGPGKSKDKDGNEEEKYTYIYEVEGAASIMNRYLDILLSEEEGFVLTDEEYSTVLDRPELEDDSGALLLVRNSVQEGHIFQLAIGWSKKNDNLAVRVSAPEGIMRSKEELMPEPASLSEQMDRMETMLPSQLGLSGSSMDDYEIYPVEGFVKVDGFDCRRFNVYPKGESTGFVAGIFLLSTDQQHIYRMDINDNSIITELR